MKSIIFTINSVIIMLIASISANACWEPYYSPSEYLMYAPILNSVETDKDEQNCVLWQKQTSMSIPTEDIRQVVYKYSVEAMETILSDSLNSENKFVQWIISKKDKEIVDFLLLAKRCEDLRADTWSPWYYPKKNDSTTYSLQRVVTEAIAYKGKRFKSRYALQAVRAMYTKRSNDECCDFWTKIERSLPDDVIKSMTKGYVAACEYRRGNKQKAREMYAELGDWLSVVDCMDSIPENKYDKLDIGLKYAPNSKSIQNYVAGQIFLRERYGNCSWMWDYKTEEAITNYKKLMKICHRTARNPQVKDKSFWWYSAAFMADRFDKTNDAINYIAMAERTCKKTDFLERIKIMSIYFQAKTRRCNENFDGWLYNKLTWLDKLIKRDASDENGMITCSLYDLSGNISFFYCHDMMRKIILGEVCPKLMKSGRKIRAMQLANYADNSLINYTKKVRGWDGEVVGETTMEVYRATCKVNNYDFSNAFFWLIDSAGVDNVVKYVRLLRNPQTEFDRFISKNSYYSDDYFNDIIGTQMLRNMRYAEAEKYLGKVSYGYQKRLNTEVYVNIDPFSCQWRKRKVTNDAKYEFAVKMNALERALKTIKEPNRKAESMLQFALGLKKSFSEAWALTYYYKGENYLWRHDALPIEERMETVSALKRAEKMENTAFAMFTDDEAAAYMHSLYVGHYDIIAERYSHTKIAKQMLSTCDNYKDYLVKRK